jgi:anaerobic selenocysteine-containing dehydrogenase
MPGLGIADGDVVDLVGIADGDVVDLVGIADDRVERRVARFRVVSYPTTRGCAAAYYPETNPLVPLDSQAEESGTPTSKSVLIRLVPHRAEVREPALAAGGAAGS